jgi:outer membrane protein
MLRKSILVLLVISICAFPILAQAEDGSWKLRGRIINISPNDDSAAILDTGTTVSVDSATTLEVDVTYMFNESWGLEVIAALAGHDLSTTGGALAGADAGTVDVLPPTITAQYFFETGGKVHPYLGAGINFTAFPSYDLSADLRGLGVTDIDFDSSFGFAANAGLDIDLNGGWLFNLDLKYITIGTDAELQTADGPLATIEVDIDPFVFGAGVGYRF